MSLDDAATLAAAWWLVILIVCFAVVLVYALWPKNKQKFDRAARIPLDKDESDER